MNSPDALTATILLGQSVCFIIMGLTLGIWRQAATVVGTMIGRKVEWLGLVGIVFAQGIARVSYALSLYFDPGIGIPIHLGGLHVEGPFELLAYACNIISIGFAQPMVKLMIDKYLGCTDWNWLGPLGIMCGVIYALGLTDNALVATQGVAVFTFAIGGTTLLFWGIRFSLKKVIAASLSMVFTAVSMVLALLVRQAGTNSALHNSMWIDLSGVFILSFASLLLLHARVVDISKNRALGFHPIRGFLAYALSFILFFSGAWWGQNFEPFHSLSCQLIGLILSLVAIFMHFRTLGLNVASFIQKLGEDRAISLLNGVSASAFLCNKVDGRIVEASASARDLVGMQKSELIGANVWDLMHVSPIGSKDEDRTDVLGRTLHLSRASLGEDQPELEVITALDVTGQRAAERALERLASYDALCDLPNRREALARLENLIDKRTPSGELVGFTLLFLDLDHFKTINDTKGHGAGDVILKKCARLFESISLDAGGWCARFGGDEFLSVLPSVVDPKLGQHVGASLIKGLEESELAITGLGLSVGIAVCPKDGDTVEDIIRRADAAMYKAKAMGRGRHYAFDKSIEDKILHEVFVDNYLRTALKDETGLSLWLQPICKPNGEWTGESEALLRAPGTNLGPKDLIACAEKGNHIIPLGRWVLKEALRMQRRAAMEGIWLSVAINVSAKQFADTVFWQQLKEASVNDALAQRLTLEVTETALMEDEGQAQLCLLDAQHLGYKIALDDFGSGYSSLSMLQMVPLSKMKLDKSLIDRVPADDHSAKITGAAIAMGQALELVILAEGVETKEQADWLIAQGVPRVQGYLYGKPMPEQEFWQWARTKKSPLLSDQGQSM